MIFVSLIFMMGCSYFDFSANKTSKLPSETYHYYSSKDYKDYLNYLGKSYLKNNPKKFLELKKSQIIYLEKIFYTLASSNGSLFLYENAPKFYIVKSQIPFHFSLPDGVIFISLGLLRDYIRHEGILISLLTYEFIRSYSSYYKKLRPVPVGHISLERLLVVTRLKGKERLELDKWAFHSLRRAGYDPYVYLAWIQFLNKNSDAFSFLMGEVKDLTKEEFELKTYILESKMSIKPDKIEKNSSTDFYIFMEAFQRKI